MGSMGHQPTESTNLDCPALCFQASRHPFEIHGFADASKVGVCAALYLVTYQDSTPVDQDLLAPKSRVAPKETSIPRLELVAAHTLAKVMSAKHWFPSLSQRTITGWTASWYCAGWQIVESGQLPYVIELKRLAN